MAPNLKKLADEPVIGRPLVTSLHAAYGDLPEAAGFPDRMAELLHQLSLRAATANDDADGTEGRG